MLGACYRPYESRSCKTAHLTLLSMCSVKLWGLPRDGLSLSGRHNVPHVAVPERSCAVTMSHHPMWIGGERQVDHAPSKLTMLTTKGVWRL